MIDLQKHTKHTINYKINCIKTVHKNIILNTLNYGSLHTMLHIKCKIPQYHKLNEKMIVKSIFHKNITTSSIV